MTVVISLGVPVETHQELLKIYGSPSDFSPADGTVVGVQSGPAVPTQVVTPGTLEHGDLPGVLDVAHLRGDNHGGEINQAETYRAVREPVLDIQQI